MNRTEKNLSVDFSSVKVTYNYCNVSAFQNLFDEECFKFDRLKAGLVFTKQLSKTVTVSAMQNQSQNHQCDTTRYSDDTGIISDLLSGCFADAKRSLKTIFLETILGLTFICYMWYRQDIPTPCWI